ncbi:MAG: S8 family serine peptidase, partial [Candidatus Paceibacterota bacterium]
MSRFQKYIAAGSLFFFVAFSSLSAVYGESFLKDGAEPKKQDQKNFIGLDKVETGFLFDKTSKYVPGEVIVKFKTGEISLKGQTGLSVAKNFAAGRNLSLKENIGNQNIGVFKINGSRSVESAVQELKKDPSVEYVQPNFIYYPLDIGSNITSNDTYKNLIWGMDNFGQTVNGITGTADADIDAPEAWAINEGTNGSVIVAVLDTGVAYNHPDLAANMWDGTNCVDENGDPLGGCNHGYDYYSADNDPLPTTNSHGTHVAGTIAAVKNNGEGVIGVAPNAKIMAVRVGNSYLSDSAILSGIAFAEQNGARVINASWGGSSGSCAGAYDEALYQAIEGFDGLFVAAAGNAAADHDGSTYVGIPADYGYETSCWAGLDNVISVAATNENDGLAFFSDYGENFIDVGAPGGENPDTSDGSIYSTVAYSTLLDEDLEGTIVPNIPADWTEEGAINNWRTASVSSSNVLYGDSSFPYADNATSSITSPAYDLSSTTAATLAFSASCDTAYELEDWTDYLSLFFSSDGTNFSEVMKLDEFYIDLVNGEDPYSSSSAASVYISGSLSSGYLTDDFKIRFGWTSDGDDNNYDGCWIDDLKILKTPDLADGTAGGYDYMQGTSMATPHVAGLAALVWGYNPSLTLAQVKDVVADTGDNLVSLDGKTVSGKRINAYNALNVFNPVIGYDSDNIIPTSSISQGTDGFGRITVNFKIKDSMSGLAATLSDFGYSVDGGSIWQTPTSGDVSLALSGNWEDGGYVFSSSYPTSSYSFTFNSQHSDFADLNDVQRDNVKIRFKANDGAKDSPYAESGVFSIDNLDPSAPTADEPATTTYINSSSYYLSGTGTAGDTVVLAREGEGPLGIFAVTSTVYGFTVFLNQNAANIFSVSQYDNFGNQSPSVGFASVIEDSEAASLLLLSVDGDSDSVYNTSSTTPQIAFSSTDLSPTLSCRWDAVDASYSAMSALNGFSLDGNG